MAKVGSATVVTALTAAALAAIGVLAWQASAAQQRTGAPHPGSTASHHSGPPPESAAQKARDLPHTSGTGRRVVYSLARHRVWLVAADGTVTRSFLVSPGTISPAPGTFAVTGRTPTITGTDGVPIEHVVLFTVSKGTVIGFSAAVNGALPTPDASRHTGGIREHLADGDAMWKFAVKDTEVTVIP